MKAMFKKPLFVFSTRPMPVMTEDKQQIFQIARWHHEKFTIGKRFHYKVLDMKKEVLVQAEMRDQTLKKPVWDITFGGGLKDHIQLRVRALLGDGGSYTFHYKEQEYKISKKAHETYYIISKAEDHVITFYHHFKWYQLTHPTIMIEMNKECELPLEVVVCIIRCFEAASTSSG